MNGLLKVIDLMGQYAAQMEQQVAQLQAENQALKAQIEKMQPEAKA